MISKRSSISTALPVCLLLASGCINAPESGAPTPPLSPNSSISPSPLPAASPAASPSPAAAPASLDVSPAEARVGNVVLSLTFEAPRHMADQAAVFNATSADPAQTPTQTLPQASSQGALVLSDMIRVTNNMDPTQALPTDSAQSIVRHVVIQIRAGDTGQSVPYLGVSMDVLLDGHPLTFGQAAVPMVARDTDAPRLYYGNNVRLTQRGMHQLFVRLTRSALLGKDQPQAAQFNLLVH